MQNKAMRKAQMRRMGLQTSDDTLRHSLNIWLDWREHVAIRKHIDKLRRVAGGGILFFSVIERLLPGLLPLINDIQLLFAACS